MTLEVRGRKTGTSTVAAGAFGTDIHVADIVATLTPAADPGDCYSFDVKLTVDDPAHKPGPGAPHGPWLTWDENGKCFVGSVTATEDGHLCEHAGVDENNDPTTIRHHFSVSSSRKLGSGTLSATEDNVSATATVDYEWAESPGWSFEEPEFTPEEYEWVSVTDINLEGTPLEGHGMWVYAMQVELDKLFFDLAEEEYYWGQDTVNRQADDPLTRYTHFSSSPSGPSSLGDGIGRATVDENGEIKVYHWVAAVASATDEEWEEDGLLASFPNQVRFKAADMDVFE